MNRPEQQKLFKLGYRALRLRCAGCERVGQPMSDEHFFPKWLIEYAQVHNEGIRWLDGKTLINPSKATIPLCQQCNSTLGHSLEDPVSQIFHRLEQDDALCDRDCELLTRWMWKFEGLQWAMNAVATGHAEARYTGNRTLLERTTQPEAFAEIRERMVLAIAMCNANDHGFIDWPLGLDTPPSENAVSMSGVFGRIAIVTSLVDFLADIHPAFGTYNFGGPPTDRNEKVFQPPRTFLTANGAIAATKSTALKLMHLHDHLGDEMRANVLAPLVTDRRRVELPPV